MHTVLEALSNQGGVSPTNLDKEGLREEDKLRRRGIKVCIFFNSPQLNCYDGDGIKYIQRSANSQPHYVSDFTQMPKLSIKGHAPFDNSLP